MSVPFRQKNDYKIGHLTQDPDFDDSKTVLDTVLSSDLKEIQLIREYELIMLNYSETSGACLERVMAEMDSLRFGKLKARSRQSSASWVFRTCRPSWWIVRRSKKIDSVGAPS